MFTLAISSKISWQRSQGRLYGHEALGVIVSKVGKKREKNEIAYCFLQSLG